jgi:hypothetical protein
MWGTFECFSNIRLSVTPSGNFSVFYPVIYIIVLESIQLSGLVATHLSDWANWQYMHWLVIGLLIVVWFCVFFLTRPFRVAKKMPLYGIDWTGALLVHVLPVGPVTQMSGYQSRELDAFEYDDVDHRIEYGEVSRRSYAQTDI